MPQISFDRFDGGLLLARPSSVSPANSLAELVNMDVQPGGWLRSRPTWRKAVLDNGANMALGSLVHGLHSNGGYLWSFALSMADTQASGVITETVGGRVYRVNGEAGEASDYIAVGYLGPTYVGLGGLDGATPWDSGYLVVLRNDTAGTLTRAAFRVAVNAGTLLPEVFRTDVTDANMPTTGVMATAKSRVFALSADGQTVRFSAVGSVTDWTSAGNAGFLPVAQHFGSGQRAYGLGVYQDKLAVFTDRSIQLWALDPNPTAIALDRVIDGIGTRHHNSIVSLNGDLLFLSQTGIRSLTTLSSSLFPSDVDVGLPVNSITPSPGFLNNAKPYASNVRAIAATPFGQFWITAPYAWLFNKQADLHGWLAWSYSRQAKLNAWAWHDSHYNDQTTQYTAITGWAALGSRMFMRALGPSSMFVMSPGNYTPEETSIAVATQRNPCSVKTQWLDFGKPGKRKALTGIDFDGKGVQSIDIYVSVDGNRAGVLAESIAVGSSQGGWTYSGEMLPLSTDGTEFQLKLSAVLNQEIQVNRITLHWDDVDG